MDTLETWSKGWEAVAADLVAYLPRLGAAILLLLLGWLVARLVRALVKRVAEALERALSRASGGGPRQEVAGGDLRRRILGGVAYWSAFLVFIIAAIQVLTLDAFAGWLGPIAAHLPSIIVGGFILFAGVALAALARDLTEVWMRRAAGAEQGRLAGKIVQILVVFSAMVVGAGQMGLEITFFVVIAAIVLGALMGALALGLGLGAKDLFRNLLGVHTVRQHYRIGQSIQIGAQEGRILEITGTGAVLDTERGRMLVPGRAFNDTPSLLMDAEGGSDESS